MGRILAVSVGKPNDHARVHRTARVTFERFAELLLKNVPETEDKASAGWVCGAEFDPPYRDSENFVARHLLSLDYDHITRDQFDHVLRTFGRYAHVSYTTWSHSEQRPRLRVWLPLSRPAGYDEFSAVSRAVGAQAGIELAARESHVPAQYMFRPAIKPFADFWSEVDTESPWIDVDEILGSYNDWHNRDEWPRRAEGDGVHNEGRSPDPRAKPGIIGAFNRAFSVPDAIERFDLPYKPGSSPGRLTYTLGSRPDGAIIYDDGLKLHSHHDTDPARGQVHAYDLVRVHRFGYLDSGSEAVGVAALPSSKAMAAWAATLPDLANAAVEDCGFTDLGDDTTPAPAGGATESGPQPLPGRIIAASSLTTDQENARRIQRRFGDRLISVGEAFYTWGGTHWRQGETEAHRYVSNLSRIIKAEAEKLYEEAGDDEKKKAIADARYQWAAQAGNASKQTACIGILRNLLAFPAAELNKDRDAFSCLSGVVNLRTGDVVPHASQQFITACAPTPYDPAAEAPRFQRFLREIYESEEVIAFAQRWFGYCITGRVDEQKMVFHVGGGGNGKSVLMNTMQTVLGQDYYSTQNSGLLTLEMKGATPELARLLGKRMVTISETPDGLELREGLVKSLTGGDTISGRHLFQDYIEFQPTHKLQIFTNYKPAIKGQDEGIWRRVVLLNYPHSWGSPGDVKAGRAEHVRDTALTAALASERPGILRWLVEGAQSWYERGLDPPEAIRAATARYRSEQDVVGLFLTERTSKDPEGRVPLTGTTGSLFPAYQGWCRANGHHALGRIRFCHEISRAAPYAVEARWPEGKTPVRGYTGLKLIET